MYGNRPTQAVDLVAGAIGRVYDGLDRLTEEQTAQGDVTYGYDNASRRTTLTLPNRVTVAYTYDSDSRVTGMTYSAGSTQLGNLSYTYDADGRRTASGGSLAAVNLPANVAGGTGTAYNADNEPTKFNGVTQTYDYNGNLTADGTDTYTWDARNHLTAIGGGATASFVYDAFERRMNKTVGGTTTQFLYDRLNPVQELNGASPPAATANLLTGLGIDEYFTRTASGTTSTLLADALGSTIGLVGSGGTIATNYTYQPFGATTAGGASNTNPYQFTGRENDATGLYFNRARYYSPTLQRFIAQDPIGFGGGDPNLYSYAFNDPLAFMDPLGLTRLTFDPGQGILTVDPEQPGSSPYQMPASSGRPNCNCGPSDRNSGRIPSGDYTIMKNELSYPSYLWDLLRELRGDWGSFRVPLHPGPGTETFGRSGFYLHGGAFPGSAGCIDTGGGIFGNSDTSQLVNDILGDPDGKVPVHVK
jgi:RHS repeat-associated protein